MRPVVVAFALAVLAVLIPATEAGTASEPDIVDPAGDVQYEDPVPPPHPCADAVDLLAFWVEWTADGALFHYKFSDLAPVEEPPVQDFSGRCFYSYADFVLTRADGSDLEESLYVDYVGNPAFITGWRFYLHGSGDEGVGSVDLAAGTIDVLVPAAALGNPGIGDALGMFRVQSTTQFMSGPVVADFATDLSPDAGPCECVVPFPGPSPAATPSANETTPAPTSSVSGSASASSSASRSSTTTVRPPAAAGAATSSSEAPADADAPSKDSPVPMWLGAFAVLVAMLARRRLT